MVEMMRWPNRSYSALSTVAGVMPKRAAVARSITRLAARPCCCRSLATLARAGEAASRATSFGTHSLKAARDGFSSTNWYCVRLTAASTDKILHRLQIERYAGDPGGLLLQPPSDHRWR